MKKKMIIGIIIVILIIFTYCIIKKINKKPSDSERFAQEYTQVTENNVFVYKDVDSIIKIMEHGTGIVYLGYPECKWCQAYTKYLNEVAQEVGIEKIYYCNSKQIKETNMDKYYEIVNILEDYLEYNDEGNKWIYVPNVSFHINGKIIGTDNETAKDTHNLKTPEEYWTEEEVAELKNKLKNYMQEIKKANNMCTECNK